MSMEQEPEQKQTENIGPFNLIILVLSIYVLGALIVDTFMHVPPEVSKILHMVDNLVCLIFLYDFAVRFRQAENKLKFMRWGWIDLLSSIPFVDFLRAGRLLRLIRLLRIVRAFKSTTLLVHHVFRKKANGAITMAMVIAGMMLIFSSIAVLQVETDPNSNIKTAEDALWWAMTTITTVGYGDRFPVTTEGRIIGSLLMAVGIGLFGTFSGFVSSWLHEGHNQNPPVEEKK